MHSIWECRESLAGTEGASSKGRRFGCSSTRRAGARRADMPSVGTWSIGDSTLPEESRCEPIRLR
ncbi:hypothetical protein ACSTJS_24645, partial [Vibrio parahaemolyticus]